MQWLVGLAVSLSSLVMVGGTVLALSGQRLYYNSGVSLPSGVYVCGALREGQRTRNGEVVQLEPPPRARRVVERLAPDQAPTPLWMKQLVGQEGHTICLTGDTVTRQGTVIAHRPLYQRYPLLPVEGCWTLGPEDIFVLGTHPQSYDARYTGPWERRAIKGTCQALWTREGHS